MEDQLAEIIKTAGSGSAPIIAAWAVYRIGKLESHVKAIGTQLGAIDCPKHRRANWPTMIVAGLLLFMAALGAGCAWHRPVLTERTVARDGTQTERRLQVATIALWPATAEVARQKATLGKTFNLGIDGLREDTGGTNLVEALNALNRLLGR